MFFDVGGESVEVVFGCNGAVGDSKLARGELAAFGECLEDFVFGFSTIFADVAFLEGSAFLFGEAFEEDASFGVVGIVENVVNAFGIEVGVVEGDVAHHADEGEIHGVLEGFVDGHDVVTSVVEVGEFVDAAAGEESFGW